MTYEELVAAVARKIQDPTYSEGTDIPAFLNEGLKAIAGRVLLRGLRASAVVNTLTTGSAAPMPDNYNRELFSIFDTTTNKEVPFYRSMNLLMADYPNDYEEAGALFGVTVEQAIPAAAQGTATFADVPIADETVVIGSQTFTFIDTRTGEGEVTIGASATETATNLVTAITSDISTVTAISSIGVVTFTAESTGVAGNDIVLTSEATNITVDGNGTLGGTTIGVQTAWLRYLRTPSESHPLRVHYFRKPTTLIPEGIPHEIPEHLHDSLLVNYACKEIFTEIYGEDDNRVIDRYELRFKQALAELRVFLGPYARKPQQPTALVCWSDLVNE